ncbi:MAG: mannose-6-phosphate isomerase, class I [Microbacteriaceae bacterium]
MFEIVNAPRHYPWGSLTAFAELRGVTPSGKPEAEIWFGDHPGSPSVRVSDGLNLIEWEALDATREPLPFLLKLLAVDIPLSLQVHPSLAAARAGFERENTAEIPIDSPSRNYKDANHKPEIIRAVTTFSALSGFRPQLERNDIVAYLQGAGVDGADGLAQALASGLRDAVDGIIRHEPFAGELAAALADHVATTGVEHVDDAVNTARAIAATFPGDPGLALVLLLNHIVLQPGEALAVPAGTVHAYLSGVGVEVMASSDNVLRAGLTTKHVDADEFLAVVDFDAAASGRITPRVSENVRELSATFPDCILTEITVDGAGSLPISTPAIALVIDGTVSVGANEDTKLTPGGAVFLESTDSDFRFSGSGTLVVAHGISSR